MSTADSTKDLLAEKLIEMSREVPLRKITMTSLSKYCGVSRGTLYYHFLDVQDIIGYVFHSHVVEPLKRLMREGSDDYRYLTLLGLELMAKDGEFYRDAFAIHGQNDLSSFFREDMKKLWHLIVDLYLERQYPNLVTKSTHFYYVCDCIASGYITMVETWVTQGMKESPAEIAELLELCSVKGLFGSLDHIATTL